MKAKETKELERHQEEAELLLRPFCGGGRRSWRMRTDSKRHATSDAMTEGIASCNRTG